MVPVVWSGWTSVHVGSVVLDLSGNDADSPAL